MTLNLLLFTITVKPSAAKEHDLHVKELMEEVKERQTYYC
ncbi:YrzI family small protein [Ectobacillus antri]|jgi:uncharacterized protein (TIGR02413 family)|uniref:YrzI family small protein n=1 Tax=Ectobacillus antri TaxID=2486280 RepID=A0ABT6H9N7_9BACI|nr:YrzI family small protein [Ectobacillus antri]MDG4658308.1 YrzI family small protein [Ectobacillus antri]MDG5755525.1 YrzI family small protein [Ectobacillus antri]MDG5755603.1 YrzI family small protein [Ectobacillus antri]